MPAHSKGLTKRVTLRHTDDEDTMITNVVSAYAEHGIKISNNDAVRVCIRIGSTPVPKDVDTARARVLDHVHDCRHCTGERLGCPEGQWLWDLHTAVVAARHISRPRAVPNLPADGPVRRPQAPRPPLAPMGQRAASQGA